jgi:hypothetical protein
MCLVCFSSDGRDRPARAVDGEVANPLVDDACNSMDNPFSDMTLSVLSSRRNYVMDSSVELSSSDIRAQDKIIGFTMVLDTALE